MSQKDMVMTILREGVALGHTGKALKDFAVEKVKLGLQNNTIPWSGDRGDEGKVKSYASGVVGNYMKKEVEFHDGVPYEDRKSTRGPRDTDELLKELKANLASLKLSTDPAHKALIPRVEATIAARREEVKAEKAGQEVKSIEEAMESLARLGIPTAS